MERYVAEVSDDGWQVLIDVIEQDGRPVVERIVVEPHRAVPAGGLTARRLRRFPFGHLAQLEIARHIANRDARETEALFQRLNEILDEQSTRGRNGYPDVYYAAIAGMYRYFVTIGHADPVEQVARAVCDGVRNTAATRIKTARGRHLLTSDGRLTPLASDLLGLDF